MWKDERSSPPLLVSSELYCCVRGYIQLGLEYYLLLIIRQKYWAPLHYGAVMQEERWKPLELKKKDTSSSSHLYCALLFLVLVVFLLLLARATIASYIHRYSQSGYLRRPHNNNDGYYYTASFSHLFKSQNSILFFSGNRGRKSFFFQLYRYTHFTLNWDSVSSQQQEVSPSPKKSYHPGASTEPTTRSIFNNTWLAATRQMIPKTIAPFLSPPTFSPLTQ